MVYDTYNCSIHGLKPHQLYRLNIYGKPMEEPQEKSLEMVDVHGCSTSWLNVSWQFWIGFSLIFLGKATGSHQAWHRSHQGSKAGSGPGWSAFLRGRYCASEMTRSTWCSSAGMGWGREFSFTHEKHLMWTYYLVYEYSISIYIYSIYTS